MKRLGEKQALEVLRFTSVGAYLNAPDEIGDGDVLLPKKYLTDDIALGDMIDVFLYKDSQSRLIATTTEPRLSLGQIGLLKVVAVSARGAFLDWGLSKDLFLPAAEQKNALKVGQRVVVIVYIDRSERLCASQRIEKFLTTAHSFAVDQWIEGTIYSINPDIGAFVAVANQFYGLLPAKDCLDDLALGQALTLRIVEIHPDGKMVLSLRDRRSRQIYLDIAVILDYFKANQNCLPLTDKASPQQIKQLFRMSKKSFKRAIGVLLKAGAISIERDAIRLIADLSISELQSSDV